MHFLGRLLYVYDRFRNKTERLCSQGKQETEKTNLV